MGYKHKEEMKAVFPCRPSTMREKASNYIGMASWDTEQKPLKKKRDEVGYGWNFSWDSLLADPKET